MRDKPGVLDLDRLRAAPLSRDPFDFVVVEDFVQLDELLLAVSDFPEIRGHGSFPVDVLDCGPAFARLVDALTGPALRHVIEEKFEIDLGGRPTMLTVTVQDGTVDLWGLVHSPEEKKAARIAAELTPGVRAVVDNIIVQPPGSGWQ